MKRLMICLFFLGMTAGIYAGTALAEENYQNCVDDGQPCEQGATPCCSALSTCKGSLSEMTCQGLL